MAKLYEIVRMLDDPEALMAMATEQVVTGQEYGEDIVQEIFNEELFAQIIESLEISKDEKVENIGLIIKNTLAEIAAIKAEEKVLAERRKKKELSAERLKNYLSFALNGSKFETPKVAISWRASTKTEVVDKEKALGWLKDNNMKELIKVKIEENIDTTACKKLMKDGTEIDGLLLIESKNIQIK